jgi:peptidoglycan/xylan/chitin deacetylase (PgdA/CDA1 family)
LGRSLLLTFDDGPDLVGTSLILDELTRRGLKAVFFVNGNHIVRDRPEDLARRDLLRKLATRGHLVGNHTMNHKNLCLEREAMAKEIDGASEIIAYATSVRPLLFRSPYGARCRELDRDARRPRHHPGGVEHGSAGVARRGRGRHRQVHDRWAAPRARSR